MGEGCAFRVEEGGDGGVGRADCFRGGYVGGGDQGAAGFEEVEEDGVEWAG